MKRLAIIILALFSFVAKANALPVCEGSDQGELVKPFKHVIWSKARKKELEAKQKKQWNNCYGVKWIYVSHGLDKLKAIQKWGGYWKENKRYGFGQTIRRDGTIKVEGCVVEGSIPYKGGAAYTEDCYGHPNNTKSVKKTNSNKFSADFKNRIIDHRLKIQYVLKELGYYDDAIDGKWGKNTERAVLKYAQKEGLEDLQPSKLFERIRKSTKKIYKFNSTNKTSSNSSGVKRSNSSSNNSSNSSSNNSSTSKTSDTFYENSKITLRAIDTKPDVSAKRALHVCQAVANSARDGTTARRDNSYGYNASCNGIYGNIDCSILPQSGGMWGGLADGLANVFAKNSAAKNAAIACFADRGWAATFK